MTLIRHYALDAATIAHEWEADYLKVDFCGSNVVGLGQSQYDHWAAFRDALNATGRQIYYSICPKTNAPSGGTATPYTGHNIYAPPLNWTGPQHQALSNSWLVEYRNNVDNFGPDDKCIDAGSPCGMITNVDAVVKMTNMSWSTHGAWTDADMLQVCNYGHVNGGMSITEYRSHFSIWAMFSSPLILSMDVRTVGKEHPDCLAMVKNKDVLAINQDPLAHAGRLVYQDGTTSANIKVQVFARQLADGSRAVLLFNRDAKARNITATWDMVNLVPGQIAYPLDLWNNLKKIPGQAEKGPLNIEVESHGVSFVKLVIPKAVF